MHSGVAACINILIECRVRTFLMFKIREKKITKLYRNFVLTAMH